MKTLLINSNMLSIWMRTFVDQILKLTQASLSVGQEDLLLLIIMIE